MIHKKQIIREWFDSTEKTLEKEARQAGLFEHNTMIGSAREFLVKRILKSLLPPSIIIGSGRIIDSKDTYSKQVDIIIYDSRFPKFEIESGIGTYLSGGVIATIEVKSILDKKQFINALNNTKSILDLDVDIKPVKDPKQAMDTRRSVYSFMPSCYIFSYNSRIGSENACDILDVWYKSNDKPSVLSGTCALLPRIIIAGKTIGLLNDGTININPGEDVIEKWKRDNIAMPNNIMGFWSTKHRFGFLMSHLLMTISKRIDISHKERNIEYSIDGHLIKLDYFQTEINYKKAFFFLS